MSQYREKNGISIGHKKEKSIGIEGEKMRRAR
jgi:hypothetical protein